MAIVTGKNVYISTNTFRNNQTIVNVDLCGEPWVGNSMVNAFDRCTNLKIINNINQNVTNMTGAFYGCTSLENAPVIPNSVTYMGSTFMGCRSLVNAPVIPNSVTDIYRLFCYCTNLVNAPVIPNSVHLMFDVFTECNNLVNAPVIPNSVTYMGKTFDRCIKLKNVPAIPNSVTDMIGTFYGCTSLENAPVIPNSVTNMYMIFRQCRNLSNVITISNNVTNLSEAFYYCNNLTNAPIIPNSVTTVWGTFQYCTNLSGNIYIQSENITNATNCFNGTSLPKNVYIPFKYENAVNTKTYNSFIAAGYKTDGSVCGVYLKDINVNVVTLTINPTPNDATVILNTFNDTINGTSIDVTPNTIVSYQISKTGYHTDSGSVLVSENIEYDSILKQIETDTVYNLSQYEYTYDTDNNIIISRYTGSSGAIEIPSETKEIVTVGVSVEQNNASII